MSAATMPDRQRIDVQGIDVAYRRAGAGPVVLFLHGVGLGGRWLPVYDRLARRCDLIVPDHPGFGGSAPAEWLRDMDDLVLHYAELAGLLGLDRFHLVGHSFGGWSAAEFAAFYPERLGSLTLVTPLGLRVVGDMPIDLFRMSDEDRLAAMFNGPAPAVMEESAGDPLEALLAAYGELTAFARLAWNPRYDIRLDRRLGRVRCPTLVLGADDDRILPRSHVERYAELIPGARVAAVAGTEAPSGHGVIVQEPDGVAAQIQTMVEGSR
jgi:pimeloyl-ACP methyl ester carboxylesterase